MTSSLSDDSERNERLDRVLADCQRALETGHPLDLQELLIKHPDLADELRAFFASQDAPMDLDRSFRPADFGTTVRMTEVNAADESSGMATVRYFGDYELLRELGRGGMGVVYLARQSTLNRPVALKMILSGQTAPAEDVQRFRQEAEAAANLDHPNIAPIYETGEHQRQHYFSMKYIEGPSLRDLLPDLKQDPQAGAFLLVQIARAVHHAHQRGVLHRDLKPGNVLIDRDGTPYVTDFGLAKRVEGDSDVTRTGAIVGTPSYMAPEQARAEKSLTSAVDVYSLGAILYEVLTGEPPFRGDSPLKTLMLVTSNEPARPRTINPAADRDLETIALKCLEKDPARRYPSAAAFADDLDRWLRREPIQARPTGSFERLLKWARRHPTTAALAGMSVLTSLFLVAIIVGQRTQSSLKTVADEAQRELTATEQQRIEADRVHTEILRQRDISERSRLETLYAATINLIGQAWEVGDMDRMRRLLAELVPENSQPDLRGFEWHYLRKLAHSERAILSGHTDVVRSVAFSSDGNWCVSGSGSNDNRRPGELLRWDFDTGKSRSLFQQKSATPVSAFLGIRGLAVSPDDSLVAVSDNDRVRILDSTTGDERHALPVQRDYIGALAFSPAGDLLVIGTLDGSITLWNPESGEEVATLAKQRTGITSLAFSPAGDRLAMTTGDTRAPNFAQEATSDLAVWNMTTRMILWQSPNPGPLISSVAFSPNGNLLATGDLHRVQTWDATDGKLLHSSPEQADKHHAFFGVAFSPDGTRIASCGDSSIIRVWDVPKCRLIGTLKGHETGRVTCLAFSTDGLLATGGDDRSVRLWNPSETPERAQLGPHSWAVQATAFSGDSTSLAVADYTSVALYDPVTAERRRSISLDHWCFGMDLSPDGRFVATGGKQGSDGAGKGIVKLWDTASGQAVATLDPHTKSVRNVNFSADGRHLLATGWGRAAEESHVTVWNVEDQAEIGTWNDCPFAAFASDGRTVALMRDDGIAIWDLFARRERFRLSGPVKAETEKPPTHAMHFSADGRWLAAVRSNSSVEVWQLATQTRQATLSAHADVRRLLFSPDSKTLATMSLTELRLWNCDSFEERCTIPVGECAFVFTPESGTVITSHGGPTFWQVASGRSLLKLPGYGLPVNCLSISPDGTILAEAGGYRDENEGAFIWRAPAAE